MKEMQVRFPGEGNGNPLQYSCLGNPMDRSLEDYSPWGHKRVRHDWGTEQQQERSISSLPGFPVCASGKEPACQYRRSKRCRFAKRCLGWEDPLEEDVATHSRILAWRIPWTWEPGRLQSMGPQRVRHDWSDLAHTHIDIHLPQRPRKRKGNKGDSPFLTRQSTTKLSTMWESLYKKREGQEYWYRFLLIKKWSFRSLYNVLSEY